jgi:DNA-binding NarL/FixJ family response regulator
MWMDGVSNNAIAAALSIHGKTVYTYKRNIRMKLHLGTASRRFCHSRKEINGTTRRRTVLHYC